MALTSSQSIKNKVEVLRTELNGISDCLNTFNYVLTQNDVQTWGLTGAGEEAVSQVKVTVEKMESIAIPTLNTLINDTLAYCVKMDSINSGSGL